MSCVFNQLTPIATREVDRFWAKSRSRPMRFGARTLIKRHPAGG
jgi:hypothetical protein